MMHAATESLLKFFEYEHLPEHLKKVSEPFCELARRLVGPEFDLAGPEATVALRKLLEAKDCAVRAALTEREEA
jgi:hypothetical protein